MSIASERLGTASVHVIGQLVTVIGQAALLATMMDSVIDTLEGFAQSIAGRIRKPSMSELFHCERIDEALTVRWAENVDHRSVQLASNLKSTTTRSTTGGHDCELPTSHFELHPSIPLPEW
jgi:hypothetical protein